MKKYLPKRRTLILMSLSILALGYGIYSDPDNIGWAKAVAFIGNLITPIVAVWFSYIAVKALFDYFDGADIVNKARQEATGAGLIFLSRAIVMAALLGLFGNQLHAAPINPNTYIPTGAYTYVPTLKLEQERFWVDHPKDIYSEV